MSLDEGYLQSNPEINLRDYQHASKIFRDDNFRLAPKNDHLFHVAFDFASGIGFGEQDTNDRLQAGLLVKAVDLPSFKIENTSLNAYNRKNVIQSKIEYSPVGITFHDDSANLTNSIWQSYFEYYYGDSYSRESEYGVNTKYSDRTRVNWGYIPPAKPYFNSIRIYSLSQKKYTGYTLINPLITDWKHGKHDVSGDGMMENQMQITYETLIYTHGVIADDEDEPKFFTETAYDSSGSPLGVGLNDRPPSSVKASGGQIRASNNIFEQFTNGDPTGAVLDAVLNGDINGLARSVSSEALNLGKDIVSGKDVNDRYNFPSSVRNDILGIQNNSAVQAVQAVGVTQGTIPPINTIVRNK